MKLAALALLIFYVALWTGIIIVALHFIEKAW